MNKIQTNIYTKYTFTKYFIINLLAISKDNGQPGLVKNLRKGLLNWLYPGIIIIECNILFTLY